LLDQAFQGHPSSDASKFVHVASGGKLEIDPTGVSGANNHWQTVAQLQGVSTSDIVNVIFANHEYHVQGNVVTG
jgi:hypothetical protein